MHEYDLALTQLPQAPVPETLRVLTGTAVEHRLNVDLPKFQEVFYLRSPSAVAGLRDGKKFWSIPIIVD
jgi:hypothetical protein